MIEVAVGKRQLLNREVEERPGREADRFLRFLPPWGAIFYKGDYG